MKFGIYYSYWEQEWSADCLKYVEKIAELGFDIIEIAAQPINGYSPAHLAEVGRSARDNGITITAGLGPSPQKNLSSADPAIRKAGRAFFEKTLTNLAKLDVHIIGGALHSYWPIDSSKPVDKAGDRARGLEGISSLADFAADHRRRCSAWKCSTALRTSAEHRRRRRRLRPRGRQAQRQGDARHVPYEHRGGQLRRGDPHRGPLLGHVHTGENNRRVPGKGRLPWHEIGTALREIGYSGAVVMEPFVKMGGGVGSDIKVWRDLSDNADEAQMNEAARQALAFSRYVLG